MSQKQIKDYLLGLAAGLQHCDGQKSTRTILKREVERLHPQLDPYAVEAIVDKVTKSLRAGPYLPEKASSVDHTPKLSLRQIHLKEMAQAKQKAGLGYGHPLVEH